MDVVSLKCCDNVICFNRYWTVTGNTTACVLPTEVSYKIWSFRHDYGPYYAYLSDI